ncbi:MAG: hypothetical protein VX640_00550 [Pseudomonadota bacterium]|nr:hypothetical protein [Pseudomonadota bacterium]
MKRGLKALFLGAALAFCGGALAQPPSDYPAIMADAQAAFEAEDWAMLAERLDAAQAIRPFSLYLTRNRILARSLLGEYEEAAALARTIADRGLSLSLTGHAGFNALASRPEFAGVAERMAANLTPSGNAFLWREYKDDALLPETIAFGARGREAFVGSVRTGKILRFSEDKEAPEGFAFAPGGVYALAVSGKVVWAAANTGAPFERASAPTSAAVYAYGLRDGVLANRYVVDDAGAVLGALAATPFGLVASDSGAPRLFILRKEGERLEIFSTDPRYVNLQGVAYDETRGKLFVADYLAGVFSVDMKSGAGTLLANDADAHLGGVDGLYAYKGDLIGIQNGTTPQRIVRLRLSGAGDAVDQLDVLQQNLAEWNEPTNGAIIGDKLIYVATSNWPAYNDDGSDTEGARREPLRLMSLDLD